MSEKVAQYKPTGLYLEIWKFAKADKETTFDNLRKVFCDYSGFSGTRDDIIFESVLNCVAEAIDRKVISGLQFVSFVNYVNPGSMLNQFFKQDNTSSAAFLEGLINMLKLAKMQDHRTVFVDLSGEANEDAD